MPQARNCFSDQTSQRPFSQTEYWPADLIRLQSVSSLHSTLAGAEALGLEEEIGDLRPGKAADFVHLRPPDGGELAAVLERVTSLDQALAALFTLAGSESVREVRVEGSVVYRSSAP
jgi:guanine deaminase